MDITYGAGKFNDSGGKFVERVFAMNAKEDFVFLRYYGSLGLGRLLEEGAEEVVSFTSKGFPKAYKKTCKPEV